ncbi:MAG: hypothetical protein LBQ91_05255 [Oscillospiraceae bacterium]|jgi:hypothetical protein|nr:hypothetical protein [Oscillospiraceae bacterium]
MALGELQIFKWQSKSAAEAEQERYAKWAFPYGEKQKEAISKLLLELFPKESVATTLVPFLTAKELFDERRKNNSEEDTLDFLLNQLKKYKRLIGVKRMPTYLAVVVADRYAGEDCVYPSADEIRAKAEVIEAMRVPKKGFFSKG